MIKKRGGIIMSENNMTKKARGSALIPFLVFIVVYLGAGIILEAMGMDMAFYQFPSPVAALIGIIAVSYTHLICLRLKTIQYILQ